MNSHSSHQGRALFEAMNTPTVWMESLAMAEYAASENPSQRARSG